VPPGYAGPVLGVWDSEAFVFAQAARSSGDRFGGWWDLAALLWRYGMAPIWAMREMRAVVGCFLEMYEEPNFPWEDLGAVLEEKDLLRVTGVTGEQHLKTQGIGDKFAQEVVQARWVLLIC
jgi:prenylcysteine oxidase/farnesylcysteine lyase